ncbi:MAG: hypothetical protein ACXABY_06995, partial [Candidatus Thorarchaeota archaeon]
MYQKLRDWTALVIGVLCLPFHALLAARGHLLTAIIGALLVLLVGTSLIILSHCVGDTTLNAIQKE